MKKIILKTLEIDISNSCGNVCQGCYHNKIQNIKLTNIEDFEIYLSNIFQIIDNNKIDSIALYGGNLLEKENSSLYIDTLLNKDRLIGSYLYSTSFGKYNNIAKKNLLYILTKFKNKDFIFQFFYNYEYEEEYLKCLKDILKVAKLKTLFFAVQLINLEENDILKTLLSINNIFKKLGYNDDTFLNKLKIYLKRTLEKKIRTDDFYIEIKGLRVLIMIVYPVNKTGKKITSVVGDNCSFYNSTKIKDNYIELGMLSIEYDGFVNFHNPNCIASLQKIFHINEKKDYIYYKILLFYKFLLKNEKENSLLLDKCNNCLNFNIKNKGVFERK